MMNKKLISGILITVVAFIAVSPTFAFAQGSTARTGVDAPSEADAKNSLVKCKTVNECDWTALGETLNRVKNYGLQLAVMASIIFIVYAGVLYLVSAGNESKRTQAKSILQNVVIGFFLALAGWLIIDTITKTLNVNDQFLPEGFSR
jgi:hypothetical protein